MRFFKEFNPSDSSSQAKDSCDIQKDQVSAPRNGI